MQENLLHLVEKSCCNLVLCGETMNIFELNNINVEVEYLNNSAIYTIDTLYKHPESVYEYIFEKPYMEGRDCYGN